MRIKDQYRILEFGDLGDERGNLVVVEGEQTVRLCVDSMPIESQSLF